MKIKKILLDDLIAEGYDNSFAAGYDAAYMNMACNHEWSEFTRGYEAAVEEMYKQLKQN